MAAGHRVSPARRSGEDRDGGGWGNRLDPLWPRDDQGAESGRGPAAGHQRASVEAGRRGIAAARDGIRGATRPDRAPDYGAQSKVALGLLLAARHGVVELAANPDAALRARLHHSPRVDAPAADESLGAVLARGGRSLPGISEGRDLVERALQPAAVGGGLNLVSGPKGWTFAIYLRRLAGTVKARPLPATLMGRGCFVAPAGRERIRLCGFGGDARVLFRQSGPVRQSPRPEQAQEIFLDARDHNFG